MTKKRKQEKRHKIKKRSEKKCQKIPNVSPKDTGQEWLSAFSCSTSATHFSLSHWLHVFFLLLQRLFFFLPMEFSVDFHSLLLLFLFLLVIRGAAFVSFCFHPSKSVSVSTVSGVRPYFALGTFPKRPTDELDRNKNIYIL